MRPLSGPVAGERLCQFSHTWEEKGAPPDLVNIIKCGHRINFKSRPGLTLPLKQFETRLSPQQADIVKSEVDELVMKKALRILPYSEAVKNPGYYSKIFVVPKPNGKHRVIINMRPLNKHIEKETFRMESEKEVRTLLQPGSWASVVDLSDAYYLVSIDKGSFVDSFSKRKFTSTMLSPWVSPKVPGFSQECPDLLGV